MKINKSVLIFFILFILVLTLPVYATVTITPNVELRTSGTNVSYFVSQNMTVDRIEVTSTFLNITNSSGDFIMSATPSSGSLNITIYNFTITYKKWNISSANSSVTVNHTIGNLTPNSNVLIKKNGAGWNSFTSNSTGYISFIYTGGFSEIQLEAISPYPDGSSCSNNWECSGGYCVHGICRSTSTHCGDGYCDSGEICIQDCGGAGPIGEFLAEGCPTCPNPTDWTDCINNSQSRTIWYCNETTDYECLNVTETRSCEILGEEIEEISVFLIPFLIIIVIIFLLVFLKK